MAGAIHAAGHGNGLAKGHAKQAAREAAATETAQGGSTGPTSDAANGGGKAGKKLKKNKGGDEGAQAGAAALGGGGMACGMMGGGAAAPTAALAGGPTAQPAVPAPLTGMTGSSVMGMAGPGVVADADAHAGGGGAHGAELVAPATGDPRFINGTTGPMVGEGDAKTVKIPDGRGFGDVKGRKQNGDDKKQNNYSVTDANFNPRLGLLKANPDTGAELNYVQHIQMYNAAGYLENFAPDVYAKLVANQNAGNGTVLGGAANLMGLTQTADPSQAGIDPAGIPAQIPGSPIDAKTYVQSGKDITGQVWARMHHPESAWLMYKNLTAAGVGWEQAMVLAGDDGVSGAGRVNGVNNQNGSSGFNGGEKEIWSLGAQIGQQTGIDVIGAMMTGHNHNDQSPEAMTNPRINKKIGAAKDDRGAGRSAAIAQVLLNGKVGDAEKASANGTKADNKKILGSAGSQVANGATQAYQAAAVQAGGGATPAPIANALTGAAGGTDGLAGLIAQLQALIAQLLGGGAGEIAQAGGAVQQETQAGVRVPSPQAALAGVAPQATGAVAGSSGGCG